MAYRPPVPRQRVGASESPWRFAAESMSDGSLHALGVLTALFQSAGRADASRVPLVGIEEPEAALYPGAAGIMRDALQCAARQTQVLLTSHSPDLLDDKAISDRHLVAVASRNGETFLGVVNEAGRKGIRERLFTAGELLRLNQLDSDFDRADAPAGQELELFGRPSTRETAPKEEPD